MFVLNWNEFLFALVLTSSKAKTAPVAVASFVETEGCYTMGDFIRTWDINCIPYSYYHIIFEKVFGEGAADRCG